MLPAGRISRLNCLFSSSKTAFSTAAAAAAKKTSTTSDPEFQVGHFEHCLSAQASPMVSLSMTLPAGTKYSIDCSKDSGSVAAFYKHALLQGTENESRIALARKADLRPSPLTVTQSRDLLVFTADFHVNYLPDMIGTFADLYANRAKLELEEAVVEGPVQEAAQLDAAIAAQETRNVLADLAHQSAFGANHLYAQSGAQVDASKLAQFHASVRARSHSHAMLIGVNDSSIVTESQFNNLLASTGVHSIKSSPSTANQKAHYRAGQIRIEDCAAQNNEALLAFPVEADLPSQLLLSALLGSNYAAEQIFSSATADYALSGLFFRSQNGHDLKAVLQAALKHLKSIKIDEAVLKSAKHRALHAYTSSIDSRHERVLTFAHQFALKRAISDESQMQAALEAISLKQLQELVGAVFKQSSPTLISKGAFKELPLLEDLKH